MNSASLFWHLFAAQWLLIAGVAGWAVFAQRRLRRHSWLLDRHGERIADIGLKRARHDLARTFDELLTEPAEGSGE